MLTLKNCSHSIRKQEKSGSPKQSHEYFVSVRIPNHKHSKCNSFVLTFRHLCFPCSSCYHCMCFSSRLLSKRFIVTADSWRVTSGNLFSWLAAWLLLYNNTRLSGSFTEPDNVTVNSAYVCVCLGECCNLSG